MISIIAAVAILGGAGLIWVMYSKGGASTQAGIWNFFTRGNETSPSPDTAGAEGRENSGGSGSERYLDPEYRFSFEYPNDFTVQTMDEENGGETVLAQGSGDKRSFQIFINAFDEDMPVMTPERIHKDLPNTIVEQPQEIVLANDKRALMFFSNDPALGKTREVWVIDGGNLYQISAYAEFDTELARIMKTFAFGAENQ